MAEQQQGKPGAPHRTAPSERRHAADPSNPDRPEPPPRRTAKYRGARVFVGARIHPDSARRLDQQRSRISGASRNDWIEAALQVAATMPDEVAKAYTIARQQSTSQLALDAFDDDLDRSA